MKNFEKKFWKYKNFTYLCIVVEGSTNGPGRFPVNDKAMKTTITYDSNFYYFETMVNHNDSDYFMECCSLEADGYIMVNNGWVEDGENYTVYQKTVPMDL